MYFWETMLIEDHILLKLSAYYLHSNVSFQRKSIYFEEIMKISGSIMHLGLLKSVTQDLEKIQANLIQYLTKSTSCLIGYHLLASLKTKLYAYTEALVQH